MSARNGTAGASTGSGIRRHRPRIGLALGKPDQAEEHARTLLINAEANRVAKYTATARRVLGEIASARGDANRAEEELVRSLEPFVDHPMPLVEWRSHLALARLFAAHNRPAAAGESYRRALALLRELDAGITDAAQREAFSKIAALREVEAGAE